MSAPYDYKVLIDAPAADTAVDCGAACGWSGTVADLKEIGDCSLTPGDASPAGRCPECDALAYVKDRERPVTYYRGVPVFLSTGTNPRFNARAGGAFHWGGSFETLRKKLDAALTFEPFDALQLTNKGIEQIRVTGVDMADGEWYVESGGTSHGGRRIKFYHPIYPLDMREKLELWLAESEQWNKTESDIKEARTTMRAEIEGQGIKRPDKTDG